MKTFFVVATNKVKEEPSLVCVEGLKNKQSVSLKKQEALETMKFKISNFPLLPELTEKLVWFSDYTGYKIRVSETFLLRT